MDDINLETLEHLPEIQNPTQVFDLIKKEFENRVSLLKKYEDQGSVKVAYRYSKSFLLAPNSEEAAISGALIGEYFPAKKIQKCIRKLMCNPYDSQARAQLLESFVKRDLKVNLLVSKELLIQSLLELNQSRVTGYALNTARHMQYLYLKTLEESLILTSNSPPPPLNKFKGKDSIRQRVEYEKQIEKIKEGIMFIKECLGIFVYKRIHDEIIIDLNRILNAKRINTFIFGNAYIAILSSMCFLPPIHTIFEKWLLISVRLFGDKKVSSLFAAKMHTLNAKIAYLAYQRGDLKYRSVMVKAYNAALQYTSSSVVMSGPSKSAIDKACLKEYARVCLSISRDLPFLGIRLPEQHGKRMERIISLLSAIPKEKGALELQGLLFKALQSDETKKNQKDEE
ncbi:hypothetical protein WDW89_00475 [Deltaproteobacteria bacterium TL4]